MSEGPTGTGGGKYLGYGLDDPVLVMGLVAAGAVAVMSGFLLGYYFGGMGVSAARGLLIASSAIGALFFALAAFLSFNGSVTKYRQSLIMVHSLPLGGDELVLDVGCGRGVISVAVAKQMSSGMVVGVDEWSQWHVTGNSPRSLAANASAGGVGEKIVSVKARGTDLPFRDGKFDAVASRFGVSNFGTMKDFEAGVRQMVRVLKEGGRIGILSVGYGSRFPRILKSLGMTDVEVSRFRSGFFPFAERVTARKRFTFPESASTRSES